MRMESSIGSPRCGPRDELGIRLLFARTAFFFVRVRDRSPRFLRLGGWPAESGAHTMNHPDRVAFPPLLSSSRCVAWLAAALLVAAAAAQSASATDAAPPAPGASLPVGPTAAGFGGVYRKQVLQGPIPDNQIAGAVYVGYGASRRLFVAGGNSGQQPNRLYEYDAASRLVRNAWPQPTSSAWGMRDLTTDGRYVFGGDESLRVQVFDTITGVFQQPIDVTQAAQSSGITAVRGLTWVDWDPRTNSPFDGFAFTDITASQTVLVDRYGRLVRAFPTPVTQAYGLAWIPYARFLLYFSQHDPWLVGGRIHFTAVDIATGQPIPQLEFTGDVTVPGNAPDLNGGVAGGVAFTLEDGVILATAVHQAVADTLVEYELGRVSFYDWKGVASGPQPIDIRPHGSPDLGNQGFALRMAGAPPSTGLGVCFIGASDQTYLGMALPIELTMLGLQGSHLRVSMDVTVFGGVDANGQCSINMPIAGDPALLGARIYSQFAYFNGSMSGMSFTPRMACAVGGWVGRLLRAGACALQINAIYATCGVAAPPGGYGRCVCDSITPAATWACSALERAGYRALNGC